MPYSGPEDKGLPKHIKAMSAHQREVFVSTFNSVLAEKKKAGMGDQEAESHAFAIATTAAKKATKGKSKMTEKELGFTAVVPFFKAEARDGKMFVSMLASSDTLDKAKERVVPEFISKMKEQAAAGEIDLLENHADTVPIGKSVGVIDGATVWEEVVKRGVQASSADNLFIPEFEIDPEMPAGVKLFKMIESGKADFGASVGGKAIAKKSFDKDAGTIINELYPGALDHVVTTRKGRACNPDTMMFSAVMKSDGWQEVAEPEKTEPEEKAQEAAPPAPEPLSKETIIEIVRAVLAEERVKQEEQKPVETKASDEEGEKPAEAAPEEAKAKEEPKVEEAKPEAAKPEESASEIPAEEVEAEKAGKKFSNATRQQIESMIGSLRALIGDAQPEGETPKAEEVKKEADPKDEEIALLKAEIARQNERLEKLEAQPDTSKMPARTTVVEKEFEQNPQSQTTILEKATKLVREAQAVGDNDAIAKAREHWNKAFTMELIGAGK